MEVQINHESRGRSVACPGSGLRAPAPFLSLDERPVFTNEEIQVGALFVGELEKDPLAFGVLETFAVSLEELVRPALAADANHQRLAVVDAFRQLIGSCRE